MIEVKDPKCGKVAFYLPAFPVGRGILAADVRDKDGNPAMRGKIAECTTCGEKLDFAAINKYYGE